MTRTETNAPNNCWDFLECAMKTRNNCPAYKNNMGKDCWFFWNAQGGCPAVMIGKSCQDCGWYKINFQY